MAWRKFLPVLFLLAAAAGLPAARAGVEWGGCLEPGRNQNLRITGGAVLDFQGMIAETHRKLYDVTGHTWKQDNALTFDSSDFNLHGPYGTAGFSLDMAWKFVRLQIDSSFMSPSTEATAKRDYYIAVGEDIEYQGQNYDHLMIPAGTPFTADLTGNLTDLNFLLVPVGFNAGNVLRLNPSLDAGLLLFGGQYDIDAGATTGTKTYQYPPEEFAVGGESSGFAVIGAPQWGPGVQLRLGRADGIQLDLQVHYLFAHYDGPLSWINTADHNEKNANFDHKNLRVRGQIEIPLRRVAVSLGVQVQWIDTDGSITSTATDPAEILARQERFDKDFSLKVTSVMGTLGITF